MEERGYTLGNIDCTIIAQKPKLSPHKVNHVHAGGRKWAQTMGLAPTEYLL